MTLSIRQGSYDKKIDFVAFRVRKFIPHIYGEDIYGKSGCGATALSLLTGKDPFSFGRKDHWSSRFMYAYLRKRRFKIAELTMRNVTNFKTWLHPVTANHVVLASLKLIRGEASWVIFYDNMLYHNFDILTFDALEFLNHPIMTACLLQHPTWK